MKDFAKNVTPRKSCSDYILHDCARSFDRIRPGASQFLGTLVSEVDVIGQYNRESLAVVIGIFLHVSTTILFESSEDHRFNVHKMMAIAVGLALAAASMLLHAH